MATRGRHIRVVQPNEVKMTKFTKQQRQQIVEEFARRHNGQYSPFLFLKEVEERGGSHPAHGWFEWSDEKAATEHRLWQARSFANDLRVRFEVEEVCRQGPITVTTLEMPMVLSPVSGRREGGGYVLTDPNDPAHRVEHCSQAAAALRSWLNRYRAAVLQTPYGTKVVEHLADALQAVEAHDITEAA